MRGRGLGLVGVVAVTALALGVSSASATTFSGSCTKSGTLFMEPGYKVTPGYHDYEALASGTCTGTLDGRPYDGPAHVYIDGRMGKPMSCFAGFSNDVPGVLTFGPDPDAVDATRLDIRVYEFHVGTELPFYFSGAYNGHAAGKLSFLKEAGKPVFDACTGGGLDQVRFDLRTETVRELYG